MCPPLVHLPALSGNKVIKRCKILFGYSVLIAKIRFFRDEPNSLEEEIRKAIVYCQKHDILAEYQEEIFKLLDEGLSVEEVKQRLNQAKTACNSK